MGDPRLTHNSARVGMVDDKNRLLLHAIEGDRRRRRFWMTPGGKIEDGEFSADAAIREIKEETGYSLPPNVLSQPFKVFSSQWRFRCINYRGTHHFYFVDVQSFKVDSAGQDSLERTIITEWRWWSLDELRTSTETIDPIGLRQWLAEYLGHLHG